MCEIKFIVRMHPHMSMADRLPPLLRLKSPNPRCVHRVYLLQPPFLLIPYTHHHDKGKNKKNNMNCET